MNKYEVHGALGEGAFGDVFKARDKATGDWVAIKRFKDNNDEDIAKRELQTHAMVSSPYVVAVLDGFRHAGLLHIVLEFVPGGDMLGVISKHPRGVPAERPEIEREGDRRERGRLGLGRSLSLSLLNGLTNQ